MRERWPNRTRDAFLARHPFALSGVPGWPCLRDLGSISPKSLLSAQRVRHRIEQRCFRLALGRHRRPPLNLALERSGVQWAHKVSTAEPRNPAPPKGPYLAALSITVEEGVK